MASLSSLLNPSTSEESRREEEAPRVHHRPTSVSELLISQPEEDANINSSQTSETSVKFYAEQTNNQNAADGASKFIISKPEEHQYQPAANSPTGSYAEMGGLKGYQTLLINSRSRHLKKNDGEPYWRNEVQFEFLMRLFFNHDRVFKNPYFNTIHGFDWPDHFRYNVDKQGNLQSSRGEYLTFFELYLITLLKSSKISKILKARLMLDLNYALNFSVICLLVNIGRLNTTVNFDFEMKSQFRTYHSIPSLQVGNHSTVIEKYYQIHETVEEEAELAAKEKEKEYVGEKDYVPSAKGASGYTMSTVKQLQDTPRIKSILKSVNDLSGKSPKTFKEFIDDVSKEDHHINVVSMVFSICTHEYDIGQSFFPFDYDILVSPNLASTGSLLNDIWLRPKFKSTDKVRRFMWLLYTLLETNLSLPEILENPFNVKSSTSLQLETRANLALELSLIDHKNPRVSPAINAIKNIIPKLAIVNPMDAIDPWLNDFDTAQEVEFAAQMKHLRTQFVAAEISNSGNAPEGEENTGEKKEEKETEMHVVQADSLGRSIQVKQNPKKKPRQDSNDFSPHFYNPEKSRNISRQKIMESATSNHTIISGDKDKKIEEDYSFDNTNVKNDNGNHDYNEYEDDYAFSPVYNDEIVNHEERSESMGKNETEDYYSTSEEANHNDETDDEEINSYETKESDLNLSDSNASPFAQDSTRGHKRPNDESVELSGMDPMILSSFEDNYESDGLIGFFNYGYSGYVVNDYKKGEDGSLLLTSCVKRRKTRRQVNVEAPIKTTVNNIEAFLNKDNKSLNSNSKNAVLKREKNRTIAEFLYEIIKYKQSQAKELRLSDGNWRHFTKRLCDLNMFVEKEQKILHSNYADWGEFKTSMLKVMNKVNCVMNARSKIEKTLEEKSTSRREIKPEPTFIDNIFKDL